jgi:transcriptional regulator with XRE-family HTH domain
VTDALSDRIREAREDAGLTQEQIAPLLGVTLATVSRYERGIGKRGISVAMLARIAQVTGKPLSFFLSEVAA